MNGTHLAGIRVYEVDGVECYLRNPAATVLGVHPKTIGRRQKRGRYGRLIDPETGLVMVPIEDIHADLPQHTESEAR